MEKLVELLDSEIRIDFVLDCKCRTFIHIKSLVSTYPLAFKVQTSSPHKFLVNPPSGLVAPLSSATFQIVLKPQSQLPPTFPRSPSDRFLLKTAVAPDLNPDSPESTQSDIVNRWFNSAPHRSTYDVKLKVYFVGSFLLSHAVGAGDFEAAKSIIKRQRSLVSEFSPSEAESFYRLATRTGDQSMVGLLLEAGLKVNEGSKLDDNATLKRWSALHTAAASNQTEDVERLLKERWAVECRDKEGRTPLHLSACRGHLSSAKLLIRAGANLDARGKDGRTPLHLAVENGHRQMVEMLFEEGADPTVTNLDCCRSAIDIARDEELVDIVKILERGEDVLHAARRGELELLESLLERGASVNFCDQYGLSSIHVASLKGFKDVVMMLLEFGADLECQDIEGHTPLHLAVESGDSDTVEILIDQGANLNAKTKNGATPLYISKLMEYEDITQLLLDKGASSFLGSTSSSTCSQNK